MSHKATNWAIQQRGLEPATKLLLWHLADCHNSHTGRCDPSQERLAYELEMSRATVNRHLKKLEDVGLIRRVRRKAEDTKRRETTFYKLALDGAFSMSHDETRAMSQMEQKPCLKSDDSHVSQLRDTNQEGNQEENQEGARDLFSEDDTPRKEQTPVEILSEVISADLAEEFVAFRSEIRKKLTKISAKRIVKALRGHSNPDGVIDLSIRNGWQGVFPERVKDGPQESGRTNSNRYREIADHWGGAS